MLNQEPANYFLNMISHLRNNEEVMLYNNVLEITDAHANEVIAFLNKEYDSEKSNYPFKPPVFNSDAALWAAKTIYLSSQLLLYRQNKEADLSLLLPDYKKEIQASAFLSADLCLRFLPELIIQLKLIDSEDALLNVLENILQTWHYSGINHPLNIQTIDLEKSIMDPCFKQLYINRIIQHKKIHLAKHIVFNSSVATALGMYASEFWKEFKLETH